MQGTAKWIASGIVGVLGIFGLFLAANAGDRGFYLFGVGLAAFAVVYISAQMKQSFDAADRETPRVKTAGFGSRGGLVQ